jgi:DtxR family transcriptional regulator, manganese transport regulator
MIHYTDWRITANLLVSESVMAKRPTGKNQHERTRDDHATELAEDYVEAIADLIEAHGQCRIRDLARHFGVTHVTVNRAVSRFQRDGLVSTERYGPVELTPEGVKLAEASRRRHEIVYQFLLALGVGEKTAAIDSEGMEHHVSPETLQRMKAYTKRARSREKR